MPEFMDVHTSMAGVTNEALHEAHEADLAIQDDEQVTFKHTLLPIWISAYRYREKTYRFLVNARTGEVQGERPWSWIKILLLVVAILMVIAGIALIANSR